MFHSSRSGATIVNKERGGAHALSNVGSALSVDGQLSRYFRRGRGALRDVSARGRLSVARSFAGQHSFPVESRARRAVEVLADALCRQGDPPSALTAVVKDDGLFVAIFFALGPHRLAPFRYPYYDESYFEPSATDFTASYITQWLKQGEASEPSDGNDPG